MQKTVFVATKDDAIVARIYGLQHGQRETINRLERREVKKERIVAAVSVSNNPAYATPQEKQEVYEAEESGIIADEMEKRGFSAEDAVRYLNGVIPMKT